MTDIQAISVGCGTLDEGHVCIVVTLPCGCCRVLAPLMPNQVNDMIAQLTESRDQAMMFGAANVAETGRA